MPWFSMKQNDASTRCYKRCLGGHHVECPGNEQCFAQADCKKVKPWQPDPTSIPTPIPIEYEAIARPYDDTTLAMFQSQTPATSFEPTTPPAVSSSTLSPALIPTEPPTTTSVLTDKPTHGPCGGEPCPNEEHCRSPENWCGPGEVSFCRCSAAGGDTCFCCPKILFLNAISYC